MEYPDLGQHCSDSTCNRLDFLPFKCNHCAKTFCGDHFGRHGCDSATDARVPVCPICGALIPVRPGDDPNIRMDEHISSGCTKVPAAKKACVGCIGICLRAALGGVRAFLRRVRGRSSDDPIREWRPAVAFGDPVRRSHPGIPSGDPVRRSRPAGRYVNQCSVSACKKRELIPFQCASCKLNYCVRHRHESDHDCAARRSPSPDKARAMAPQAAAKPSAEASPKPTQASTRAAPSASASSAKTAAPAGTGSSARAAPSASASSANTAAAAGTGNSARAAPSASASSSGPAAEQVVDRAQLDRERRERQLQKAAVARAKLDSGEALTEDEQMALALVLSEEEYSRGGSAGTKKTQSTMDCIIS